MTFELSPEHHALRERARAFAATLQGHASTIDREAAVPDPLAREARELCKGDDATALVVAVEAIARGSAAVALTAAAGAGGGETFALTGLRGAPALDGSPRSQLVLAAVALGIGSAALDASLAELRLAQQEKAADSAGVEKPQWVVADAATEIDAARLLTYKAATTGKDADIAIARLMASAAAERAVDAALRIAGADALKEGSALDRLARDAKAVALVLGTEEQQRAVAAQALLPQ